MEINYDEDVSQNPFLEKLRNYYEPTLRLVTHEGWIVCVPRRGTFTKDILDKEDVEEHILMPDYDTSRTLFRTVSNKTVRFLNSTLTINYDTANSYSIRLLFEETFYIEDSYKYRVWCIERPLTCKTLSLYNNLAIVTNVQDAINLLWSEINETAHNILESGIKQFQEVYNMNDETMTLESLKNSVSKLYSECIAIILQDKKFKDINIVSAHLLQNIKIAVETYILHSLRSILPKAISAYVATDDAGLNKIIRNLDDLKYDDLGIHLDLYTSIHRGKLKLSRIVCYATVLEKLECLKRSIRYISQGIFSISSDNLLPILVYLIIKTGVSNWIAQITFIKSFRFSASCTNEADELAYLTTSLEAALEYIKSDVLIGRNKINQSSNLEKKSKNKIQEFESINYLFTCIINGDLTEVENLLASNATNLSNEISLCHPLCTCESCEISLAKHRFINQISVSSINEDGSTALHIASFYGQVTIVDYLLSRKAEINVTNNALLTPLHCASMKGHQNIVLLLLHANAKPTMVDNHGNTALHLASDRGHEGCVKALLYFAEQTNLLLDVNPSNIDGDTPLHRASKWGYLGIIEVLLEYGADSKIKNKWGQTPFNVAQSERVTILLERTTSNIVLTNSLFPCKIRVRHSSDHLKKYYSSNICNIAQTNKLFAAIIAGDIHLANYYLGLHHENEQITVRTDLCHPLCYCERCAPVYECSGKKNKISAVIFNLYNENGETVLHVASTVGCLEIIQLFLDAGANVNVTTKFENRTPLHLACLANKIQVVKIILRCAACNINAKDFNGDTPLHLTARNGNIKIMELLIRSGANTNIRNLRNITPALELEKQMSKDVVLRILKCNSIEYPDHYFSGID